MKCISCGCWLSNMGYEDMVCILSGFRGGEDLGILILLSFPALVLKILSFALFFIFFSSKASSPSFRVNFLWPLFKFHNIPIFLRLYVFFPEEMHCSSVPPHVSIAHTMGMRHFLENQRHSFYIIFSHGYVMIILVIVNH